MKIILVGGGAASLYLAILLKLYDPNIDLTIIEKEEKLGKKLLITGNGRCNLGNKVIFPHSYNNEDYYNDFGFTSFKELEGFLRDIGVETTTLNDSYVYPLSLSSKNYRNYLVSIIKSFHVRTLLNEKVVDYLVEDDKIKVFTDNREMECDFLVFGTGGCSYPKLGSDGNLFELFKQKGYAVKPRNPGLTRIYINENLSSIENQRINATVSILQNDEEIYSEEGEVLFKKDSLSGICIFNLSSIISRKRIKECEIKVKIKLPRENISTRIMSRLARKMENLNPLKGIFSDEMSDYLSSKINKNIKRDSEEYFEEVLNLSQNLVFTYKHLGDFSDSQVTIGGVATHNLTSYVESRVEKNVYFIGEVVDIDGLCGGYNLMYDFESAKIASDLIIKKLLKS